MQQNKFLRFFEKYGYIILVLIGFCLLLQKNYLLGGAMIGIGVASYDSDKI